jgi:hypothetical protein
VKRLKSIEKRHKQKKAKEEKGLFRKEKKLTKS